MGASAKKRKVFSSGTPAALQIYYIGGDDGILGGAYRGICTYISIHIYIYTVRIYTHYIMLDSVGELLMEKKKSHQRSYFL